MPYQRNEGKRPDKCAIIDADGNPTGGFRRVHVRLFGGFETRGSDNDKAGWPSGGRGECNWRISRPPHPFEIREYEVI